MPQYREIGSVCGGGRYENLAGYFTEQKLPGVGGSIGLTRLFYVLNENDLLNEEEKELIDYAVIPISENEHGYAFRIADELRKNSSATVVLTGKKLGDKMAYAAKMARYGIVIGENETLSGKINVKDSVTGKKTELVIGDKM